MSIEMPVEIKLPKNWAEIVAEKLKESGDYVHVVRCKDCHYWDEAKVNKRGFLICPVSGMDITPDDFCSYGERKENEA